MDLSRQILSDITVYMKYAKYIPELKRRETWVEIVTRNKDMHIKKFPQLKDEIEDVYKFVYDKKILPSMRSLQFAGKPIEIGPQRIFNCAYLPIDDWRAFQEVMFLLLSGCGVGFSVQKHHIEKLPEIKKPNPNKTKRWLVADSIEGWADSIKTLMKSYFTGGATMLFDFRDIRAKGMPLLTSGGKAPGAQPLRECLIKIDGILANKTTGSQLTSVEVHDIICHIADAVLAGGIRRAALISLFNADDDEMISCKSGNWWEQNPQRGRANNSAVLVRHKITEEFFMNLWKRVELSGAGEPGIIFSNDKNFGTNPCCISGESNILTSDGYKKIKNIVGDVKLVNCNGDIVDGLVVETGVKNTIKLKLGNPKYPIELNLTSDHIVKLSNGKSCRTDKLIVGDRLEPFYSIKQSFDEDELRYGFIFGDGTFRKNRILHKHVECNFTPIKDDEIKILFNRSGWSKSERLFTTDIPYSKILDRGIDLDNKIDEKVLPKVMSKSFLTGLYSANGSVINKSRVAFKTTSKQLAIQLQETLLNYGFINPYITTNKEKLVEFKNGSYTCKESYDVNLGNLKDIILFASEISFGQTYKRVSLEKLIKEKAPRIYSISHNEAPENVYDFSLFDETHWGVVDGVVIHNCEIALKPNCFCNLTEINASDIESQEDFNQRAKAAAFLGTLQASYTDFHYLRPIWKKTTEKDALLGVGMTGIASNKIFEFDIKEAAKILVEENKRVSALLNINQAARIGTVKPSGTSSLVLGCSSGIHAWHSQYYIRRIRVGKNEAIYTYLKNNHPELLEDDYFRPHDTAIISVPQKAPDGATLRTESPIDLLERVKKIRSEWIAPSHKSGDNMHNVSCTVSIPTDAWEAVGKWMWENRKFYNGLSVLPHDGGTYTQAPFEDITEEKYNELVGTLHGVDLSKIIEETDDTNLQGEAACAGGACEINY
jgi:hypothetical protein